MCDNISEESYLRDFAIQRLKKYKEYERKTKFKKYILNKNTIVFCKSENSLDKYIKQSQTNKIILRNNE